jgi:putative transposase
LVEVVMRVRSQREKGRECATSRKSARAAKAAQKAWHGTPELPFKSRGGRRKGAGRKAAKRADGKRMHHPHTAREHFTWSKPVHVTVRVVAGLPSLRGAMLAPLVLKALEKGNERDGFRLIHFSVQSNHYHAICEADGAEALGAAIKGLNVRIARAINKRLGRKGPVIEDRYHVEVLRSPTQVRNAVRYVLRNGEKHGVHVALRHGDGRPCPDPLSSAAWYGYWKEGELNVLATQSAATVVRPAQCYLLREGLRRAERLSLLDAPPAQGKAAQQKGRRARFSGATGQAERTPGAGSSARSASRAGLERSRAAPAPSTASGGRLGP